MILRTLTAAMLAALAVAPTADAAMCIRLSTNPQRPIVGRAAVIEIKTYAPMPNGQLKPQIVRSYPFRLVAISPRGRTFRVGVKRSRNPYAWRATFRFRSLGVWTVWVTNFPPHATGCGEQLKVRVRRR